MLYTESFEGTVPAQAPTPPVVKKWWDVVANRMSGPQVDLGLAMGSSSFSLELPGRGLSQPARVAVQIGKGTIVALGDEAAQMEGREPEGIAVVRPLCGGVVVDSDRARRLLSSVLLASKHGVLFGPRVVAAVPSDLSAVEQQAFLATVRAAGAREVHLVDQVLLAAVGAGLDVMEPRGRLVVHVGAGVAQTAVLSLGHPVVSRTMRVAGDAMNDAIREHVRRTHEILIDDGVADLLKRELGCALPVDPPLRREVAGRHLTQGKPVRVTLDSNEIHGVLEPLVQALAREVRQVLANMSIQFLDDVSRDGAVLTGGGAYLRRLDEYLSQETRLRFRLAAQPETAAARGLRRFLNDRRLRQTVLRSGHSRVPPSPGSARGWLVAALLAATSMLLIASAQDQLRQGIPTPVDQFLNSGLGPAYTVAAAPASLAAPEPSTVGLEALREEQSRRLVSLAEENERLRKLMNGPTGFPAWMAAEPVVGRVVARDPRGWLSTLVLDVGTESGVRQGAVVVGVDGLVGQVVSTAAGTSRVRLFTGEDSVVAGTVSMRKAAGVLTGRGEKLVELRYLDPDAGVKPGDKVFTSGLDGLYPRGIMLGRVSQVDPMPQGNSQAAEVRPAVDFDSLREVLVLREATG